MNNWTKHTLMSNIRNELGKRVQPIIIGQNQEFMHQCIVYEIKRQDNWKLKVEIRISFNDTLHIITSLDIFVERA